MPTYPVSDPITFLLIHGSWHWGHSWDGVRAHLEAAGHTVHTPDLAFKDKNGKTVESFDQAVEPVLDLIKEKDLKDFVLVGHSWAGLVITHLATKPELDGRIKRMIYQNAFVVSEGESQFDVVPPFAKIFYGSLAAQSEDNTFLCPLPIFRDAFMGEADIKTVQKVWSTLRTQPYSLWDEPVKNTEAFFEMPPKIPRSVVFADGDCTVPFGTYEAQAEKLGIYRFIRMGGSHEVLFTDPEGLANAFIKGGRD
ncbi:hypothetical protein ABW20_dc0106911 [Dactylellina cionopaga]|nr:hypothetical protein ABW20_dc0106911 [Dactylellina cionopaga]